LKLESGEGFRRTEEARYLGVRRQLVWVVLAALAVRLLAMAFLYQEQLDPQLDHWKFGHETGRVARSIVQGKGIGNPLFTDTGPTAFMTPLYAFVVAGAFKLFGIYTKASALVLLSLNALTSALTCLPMFYIGRKSFGDRVGMWAAWVWAFFPYAVYFPMERIWSTWLSTLLLTLLFLAVLYLQDTSNLWAWTAYGLLWGLAGLTEPIALSVLPALSLSAGYRLLRQRKSWFLPLVASALAFLLFVSPWFVRNYRVFHQFIPFRDTMGLEWAIGNSGYSFHWRPSEVGPWRNEADWVEFKRASEWKYMAEKQRQDLLLHCKPPPVVRRSDGAPNRLYLDRILEFQSGVSC
jgi:Dolichyl-phosphate-mannose-protein mannosyltransferase